MLYIGIDLGTSAVKLLLMSGDGEIRKIVSKEYPLYFPHPGWSEQNPEDWYSQTMEGIKELLEDQDKSQVAGISFGGQMHGLVILDKGDKVIRPAILWNDGRTGEECAYLNGEIGRDVISAETGNIAFAGFTAPKLLWIKKHEPENFARIRRIMLPKDYLAYRLTGVHATDVSDASGMLLFDVQNRKWSPKMCELCGVTTDQLAKVFESYEVIGTVKEEIAADLDIRKDVRVIAGAGDNAAAAVGTGVGDGVGEGIGVAVAVGDGVAVGFGVEVAGGFGVPVGVGEGAGVAVGVSVGVEDGAGVCVGFGVGVNVAVAVGMAVGRGVAVGVALGDAVGFGVTVGDAVGDGVRVGDAVSCGVQVGAAVGRGV